MISALVCGSAFLPASASADSLTVNATGTIAGSCGISVVSDFPANANLAVSGSASASASVSCATPFKLNATSANGNLKNLVAAVSSFTNTLAYVLTVSVALDSGGPVSANCNSATLVAGQSGCALSPANSTGLSSGSAIATNKTATLTAAWTTPASPQLVAGSYADTLTISIAAVP